MRRISSLVSGVVAVMSLVACSGSSHRGGGGFSGAGGSGAQTGTGVGDDDGPGNQPVSKGGSTGDPDLPGGGGTKAGNGGSSGNGGQSSNGGGPSSVPLSLEQFPAAFAAAACSRMFECCTANELSMSPLGGGEAQCKSLFTTAATSLTAPLKASVAAGRAEYDGALLRACLMDYASTSCTELRSSGDIMGACEQFVKPKVALDGACTESFDCIDSYCDTASDTCQPKKPNGAACVEDDDECQSDFCDGETCTTEPAGEGGLCDL